MGGRAGRLPPRRRPFADEVSPGSRTVVKYEIIIYWSREDEAFIAEVPELPGCTADGSTYQKALDNVQVVIQEWIETAKHSAGYHGADEAAHLRLINTDLCRR